MPDLRASIALQVVLPLAVDRVEQQQLAELIEVLAELLEADLEGRSSIDGCTVEQISLRGIEAISGTSALGPNLRSSHSVIESTIDRLVLVGRVAASTIGSRSSSNMPSTFVAQVDALEHLLSLAVDELALLVHHLVVLEEVLADVEVALLDLASAPWRCRALTIALSIAFAFLEAELLHHALDPIAREDAHEVVVEAQVEARRTRVALTTATTAQLVVDAPRLVPLGADHEQAAQPDDLVAVRLAAP
jgi:hypothetical protein